MGSWPTVCVLKTYCVVPKVTMLPEGGEPTMFIRFVMSVIGQDLVVSLQTDLEPLPHFLYPAGIIISEQIESSES